MLVPNTYKYQISSSITGTYAPTLTAWYEFVMPFNAVQSTDLAAVPIQRIITTTNAGTGNAIGYPTYVNNQLHDLFVSVTFTWTSAGFLEFLATNILGLVATATGIVCIGFITQPYNAPASGTLSGIAWPMIGEFYACDYTSTNCTLTHWFEYKLT
jgi:hypothetical protein